MDYNWDGEGILWRKSVGEHGLEGEGLVHYVHVVNSKQ